MSCPALLIRLRPQGPWRPGSRTGERQEVETVLHSDTIFSAVTGALRELGWLEAWVNASAGEDPPPVRFSSFFPWLDSTLLIPPPMSHWPPPVPHKLRLKAMRFVPIQVAVDCVRGVWPHEEEWRTDGPSGCLVPADAPSGPFRTHYRVRTPVDRISGASVSADRIAVLEFREGAGWWGLALFRDAEAQQQWEPAVRAAFRLLADSGIGGGKTNGWGRFWQPQFTRGEFPSLVATQLESLANESSEQEESAEAIEVVRGFWLWSLYNPHPEDSVAWEEASYRTLVRGGRVESLGEWGLPKRSVRMIEEGSVLRTDSELRGRLTDVAPEGFPHPIYRCGFAVGVPIQWRRPR